VAHEQYNIICVKLMSGIYRGIVIYWGRMVLVISTTIYLGNEINQDLVIHDVVELFSTEEGESNY
jgi:hypothetical protein